MTMAYKYNHRNKYKKKMDNFSWLFWPLKLCLCEFYRAKVASLKNTLQAKSKGPKTLRGKNKESKTPLGGE